MSYKPLNSSKVYLITGAAGFIGYYLSKRLLESGCKVIGIDNLNEYYNVKLKHDRLNRLELNKNFTFVKGDISDKELVTSLFKQHQPKIVVNLAAQAGVRYSIENPDVYIQSNVIGFYNILEACRHYPVDHLLYASSSSVYGANKKVPFEETDFVDNPVSLYASTKKSNELMAHTYSHLYKIPATGLRFFTVYGPMGRPDMAYFGFTDKLFADEEIKIFNNGDFKNDLYRDFTYVDDIIEGIQRLLPNPPNEVEQAPHKIFNIGNSSPEKLMVFIETLEKCLSNSLGRTIEFKKKFEPIKPGDVPATYASTKLLEEAIGFKPKTTIEKGLQKFTDWYCEYYKIM
ncbi:SDR family NAD(P)-dependent oxidoreductase [Planococcus soli]|uniref:SDR family NAD(P)-dependent oxidoreductase n=1 Tax=Planococcus soli TaxID=2666072 RepID=UPI00115F3C22|nr:SDR family NAD(P)-dependent oxidoreductase [Planococcus soli]